MGKVIGVPSRSTRECLLLDFNFLLSPRRHFYVFISSVSLCLHLQVYPVTALTTPNLVLTLLVMVGYKNSYFQFDKLGPFFQGKHGEFTIFFRNFCSKLVFLYPFGSIKSTISAWQKKKKEKKKNHT